MLINAQSPEQLRIAIVSDSTLEDFQLEVAESGLTRGNIYRGVIANIQPALNAAFIEYGADRHGFLAIQDVVAQAYYHTPAGRPRIDEVLERGRPIVVQVSKEGEGQKGAVLTTNLSLAGRYLVLMPFDDTSGVSRKVEDEEMRRELKDLVAKLELPAGCGVIVRTNALGQTKTTLQRDLAALLRLWKRIESEARGGKGTKLLYSDQDLILQALRDYLDSAVEEVLVDDDRAFDRASEYLHAFMPRGKTRLERYTERVPLFTRFSLEPQIDRIYERRVGLPSGGSIVIDRTEALTAIDVNSGGATRGANQEETAVQTNVEAALEVARQLRLRDIGGLLVVDFIDMRAGKNRRRVEKTLRDAMKPDKARFSVGHISPNGLLEINRQRIRQALQLRTHRACPTCAGTGRIASPEFVGLSLLRRIEARAASGNLRGVRISLHPELADAFQNGRRQDLAALEREFGLRVEIVSSPSLHRPDEEISWVEGKPQVEPRPAARAEQAPVHARELATPAPPPPVVESAEEGGGGDKRGRKRRRGRRKHKEHGPEGAAPANEGAPPAPTEASGAAAEATESGGEENGAARPRKRRSRRRRGRAGSTAAAGETGAPD